MLSNGSENRFSEETNMSLYKKLHRFYFGIDLHARTIYLCILDSQRNVLLHKNYRCDPAIFLRIIAPSRENIVVCVECIFTWYRLADVLRSGKYPGGLLQHPGEKATSSRHRVRVASHANLAEWTSQSTSEEVSR